MSKKKRKNSNYGGVQTDTAAKKALTQEEKDKRKNVIIYSVLGALAVMIVAVIVLAALPKTYYVEMDFGEYGTVTIELDDENAPITVKNFRKLVKRDFYDGLTIFRAQEGFVVQGGENENVELTPIVGEFSSNGYENNISHTRGIISMARTSDPDSATSQFFIVLDDAAKSSLDGSYAGFGKVVEGMDVIDKIAEALYPHATNSMGFVDDANAITIVSARAYTVFFK
ncbi:MAG: peptidylprolyl isomerase [Clostridia bacterium]|nr:peptidylprolyl isomerase [Clostridia bacterium]